MLYTDDVALVSPPPEQLGEMIVVIATVCTIFDLTGTEDDKTAEERGIRRNRGGCVYPRGGRIKNDRSMIVIEGADEFRVQGFTIACSSTFERDRKDQRESSPIQAYLG